MSAMLAFSLGTLAILFVGYYYQRGLPLMGLAGDALLLLMLLAGFVTFGGSYYFARRARRG